MHIAVCDDNIADRHQMERLLKRESDKRASTTGILYIDSYGNSEALLANPMQYDAYYIDVCKTEGVTGLDIAHNLFGKGIAKPIILCCSDMDYRLLPYPDDMGELLFLDKPIKVEELASTLDVALETKSRAVPKIELREDQETYYVTEPEILYAVTDGRYLVVTLSDGRMVRIMSDMDNFAEQLENFPSFAEISSKELINARHICAIQRRKVIMNDGAVFKVARGYIDIVKRTYEQTK